MTDSIRNHLAALGSLLALPPEDQTWDLDVFVPGHAATQGSIRAITHRSTGRAVAIKDNNAHQKSWRQDVAYLAGQAWRATVAGDTGPTQNPVAIVVEYVLPRRKSAPVRSTPPHTRKPDLDKLTRAVWDGLTHVVIADDSQVIVSAEHKREAEPGEAPGARIRLAVLSAGAR